VQLLAHGNVRETSATIGVYGTFLGGTVLAIILKCLALGEDHAAMKDRE